jgi:hypothetical protein
MLRTTINTVTIVLCLENILFIWQINATFDLRIKNGTLELEIEKVIIIFCPLLILGQLIFRQLKVFI